MKYFLYIAFLYIFLLFNIHFDLVAILIFFIVFNENDRFALLFSFFAGFLIDLYHPVVLGINVLIYITLVQTLLFMKKYIAQNLVVTFALFTTFYLVKTVSVHLVFSIPLNIQTIIITILLFFPVFMALNKIVHKIWIKT